MHPSNNHPAVFSSTFRACAQTSSKAMAEILGRLTSFSPGEFKVIIFRCVRWWRESCTVRCDTAFVSAVH